MKSRRRGRLVSISLGATICRKDGIIDIEALRSISKQFGRIVSKGYCIAAIVGAGGLGRRYIELSRNYEAGKEIDRLGIRASRINALLLIAALRTHRASMPTTVNEMIQSIRECEEGIAVISGGLGGGLTSDSSAAKVAKRLGCPLIIVSTVGGLYDMEHPLPPAKKKLEWVSRDYLRRIDPNKSHVLDSKTCKILLGIPKRKGFTALVTDYVHIERALEYASSKRNDPSFTRINLG